MATTANEIKKIATTVVENENTATATIKIEAMATVAIKKNMMDNDAIKKEKKVMDTNAIRTKEKSKDVSQQECEDFNLDCIYDNSPLGFEKSMSLGLKKMETHDPLEEINLGTKEN